VKRKDTLHADPVGNSPHRESLVHAPALSGDADAFEVLDTFLVALDDPHGDAEGVSRPEIGNLLLEMIPGYFGDD
jgi:hypothetical protein